MRFAEIDRDRLTLRRWIEEGLVLGIYRQRTTLASSCAAIACHASTHFSRTIATTSELAVHAIDDPLTQPEISVLRLVSVGKTNKQMIVTAECLLLRYDAASWSARLRSI